MASRPLKVIILAAGQGTRMKSDLPKVLHPVAGRPMLGYVVDAARALRPERLVIVVGYAADKVKAYLAEGFPGTAFTYAVQEPQLGTGHALLSARDAIGWEEADLLLLYGDIPLVRTATLQTLIDGHLSTAAVATVLTAIVDDPSGYGRIIRDPGTKEIARIVEHADASRSERAISEINIGIYCFKVPEVFPLLDRLTVANEQKELYLVDMVGLLLREGRRVATVVADDPDEVEGVNSRVQLARSEAARRAGILATLMRSGVTVTDPASTYVDWGVEVGRDTVLEPGSILRGKTRIGRDCSIGPWSQLIDAVVGDGCRVWSSVVESSRVADEASVGPFSRLRPGTKVGSKAKVGNFAELKNSDVGPGAKIQHHSYIGDADIGPDANIGAGTVVVNYDGVAKHRTVIGRGAFVGCNSNLVAPVKVGDGAYTGAGTTVTQDVPPGTLAVARPRQTNLEGWVQRRRPGTVSAEAAREAGVGGRGSPKECDDSDKTRQSGGKG